MSTGPESASSTEKTFKNYSADQVKEYAKRRSGYPAALINEIVDLHRRTGGECKCVLDIGCGPGNSTRDLAAHFDHAIGLDPAAGMVTAAQETGGRGRKSPIAYMQGSAETCEDVADNSVDLISAGTSAHWFDMQRFWPTAARVLKPKGTVAFFTVWGMAYYPTDAPEAKEIQRILDDLERHDPGGLGPYQAVPGNWHLISVYKDLQMPWSISPPCEAFPEAGYKYQIWNPDGAPDPVDGSYMNGLRPMTFEDAATWIGTISAATRWREAHPDIAHTEEDCIIAAFARIRSIMRAAGKTEDKITFVGPTGLVTVKKRG